MNYSILKTIIETSILQYMCQNCNQKIDENSINIIKIGDGIIDFHVTCPHCRSEAQMHAEIGTAQAQIPQNRVSPTIDSLPRVNQNAIKESDIVDVEKNLSEKISIEDLLK